MGVAGVPATFGVNSCCGLLRAGLANLLLQLLTGVADALVLVRVGYAKRAHVSGHLADLLAVDAGDREVRLLRVDGDVDAAGERKLDRVREAEREDHGVLALHFGAVADTDDVQLLGPSGSDAGDRVVDQRTR